MTSRRNDSATARVVGLLATLSAGLVHVNKSAQAQRAEPVILELTSVDALVVVPAPPPTPANTPDGVEVVVESGGSFTIDGSTSVRGRVVVRDGGEMVVTRGGSLEVGAPRPATRVTRAPAATAQVLPPPRVLTPRPALRPLPRPQWERPNALDQRTTRTEPERHRLRLLAQLDVGVLSQTGVDDLGFRFGLGLRVQSASRFDLDIDAQAGALATSNFGNTTGFFSLRTTGAVRIADTGGFFMRIGGGARLFGHDDMGGLFPEGIAGLGVRTRRHDFYFDGFLGGRRDLGSYGGGRALAAFTVVENSAQLLIGVEVSSWGLDPRHDVRAGSASSPTRALHVAPTIGIGGALR